MSDTLAKAFCDDPIMSSLMPSAADARMRSVFSMEADLSKGGPPIWGMWRDPR